MFRARRGAFTLVELLVVIAIIAVLVGILLPALAKARAQAQEIQCMSEIRQFGMGLQMYVDQNKGQLPQKGPGGTNTGNDSFGPAGGVIGVNDPSLWFNAIPPFVNQKSYYDMLVWAQGIPGATALQNGHEGPPIPLPHAGDNSVFICPVQAMPGSYDLNTGGNGGDQYSTDGNYFVLNGPNVSTATPHGVDSYGVLQLGSNHPATSFNWASTFVFNSKLTTVATGVGASTSELGNSGPSIKMSSLQPTSEVVVMTEMIANAGEYKDQYVHAYYNDPRYAAVHNSGAIANPFNSQGQYANNVAQAKACWTRFTTRHNHGGNLLFADGHVAWFSWTDVQIPLDGSTNYSANQPSKVTWCPIGPTD
jgi:prepilin-type N-terminal cleavage/methylation domain-containing protein/prepilin-type processing-associated H-X9-DG protein